VSPASLRTDRQRFEALVTAALDAIPGEFAPYLENVVVCVEERPSAALLRSLGMDPRRDTLFGLYEGTALSERSVEFAGQPPDRITIFRQPILDECHRERDVKREIERTIVHEIAHFFGLDEERVRELGYE
jgi:predicted Zn-dependent protease with MMP-like domain